MVKKIVMILITLMVIAATVFSVRFLLDQKNKAAEVKKIEAVCANFPKNQGEISCQEAVKIALGKYPGEAISVKIFDNYNIRNGQKNIWLVVVHLKNQLFFGTENLGEYLNFINVGVDRSAGETLFIYKANI